MKSWKILIPIAIAILCAIGAMAQAVFTPFTGTVALSVPPHGGTIQCPGGEPTPAGPAPCSPGSRINVRGVEFAHALAATDSRASGTLHVVMNANTDGWTLWGPGSGPMWGTFRLELPGAGVWDGSWTGDRTVTAAGASASVQGMMHGTASPVEGQQLKLECAFEPPAAFAGTCSGRILAPSSK